MGKFGVPRRIRSDQGSAFVSNEMKSFSKSNNIVQKFSAAGDQLGTGQLERFIRTIKERMGAAEIAKKNRQNGSTEILKHIIWGVRSTPTRIEDITLREIFRKKTDYLATNISAQTKFGKLELVSH